MALDKIYIYDADMESKSESQTELVPHLLHAIQNEEFSLVYQPKGCLNGDTIMSDEALLRWNHPTKWVIDTVIAQKEEWKRAGMPVKIALNISAKDLNNKSLMNYLTEVIENQDIELSLLEVELTERGILENQEIVMPFFNDLKRRGCKVTAEGLESKEQVEILRSLGCDYIQGYYLSKPLLPDELMEFYAQGVSL